MNQPSERLRLALMVAREAGEITLRYFRRDDLRVDHKQDDSPVTIADREAEQHLRDRIADAFPKDAIVGEEFDDREGTSGYRWILDPIDGTKSFISGVPLYGTLIGVEHNGECLLGVISMPALGETVYAETGGGAWYVHGNAEPTPAKVSSSEHLAEGLFCTTAVGSFGETDRLPAYDRLQAEARVTRTWGDCYGYLLVVTGRAAVMVDPIMNVWDAAALKPILEEAGGRFTDWTGQPTIHSGEGVGTNGHVHDEVIGLLSGES